MPVTATVLGTASGSGVDLTIPITVNQPAGSVALLACAAYTGPEHFFESQGFRSDPTDTAGGTWSGAVGLPSVGNTGDQTGTFGVNAVFGNLDSSARLGGPALSSGGGGPAPRPGCTTCGSMLGGTVLSAGGGGAGDSVTVHWFNTNSLDPNPTLGIVFALEGVQNTVETSDQSQYGNGDSYPTLGVSASALVWNTDLGAGFMPTPAADCAAYTIASGRGPHTWAPVNGSTIATVTSGGTMLAVSVDTAVSSASTWEPGGNYDVAGSILVANYQFVRI